MENVTHVAESGREMSLEDVGPNVADFSNAHGTIIKDQLCDLLQNVNPQRCEGCISCINLV